MLSNTRVPETDYAKEKLVREPTIPEQIDHAYGYLVQAHAVLDRLEGRDHGPGQATPESLVGMTAALSESAASIQSRLLTLFGEG